VAEKGDTVEEHRVKVISLEELLNAAGLQGRVELEDLEHGEKRRVEPKRLVFYVSEPVEPVDTP